MKTHVACLMVVLANAVCAQASAQTLPDTENGRYTLQATPDGVIRLDTRSGAVSTCTDKGTGWACTLVPDERAAFDTEIGRLQKDNESLKAQLAQREPPATGKIDEALPKQDSLKPKVTDGQRKIEIPLPSDRDIDRVMGLMENAWRRLVDMANRVQRDVGGRI